MIHGVRPLPGLFKKGYPLWKGWGGEISQSLLSLHNSINIIIVDIDMNKEESSKTIYFIIVQGITLLRIPLALLFSVFLFSPLP